jgi:hypothetical protein
MANHVSGETRVAVGRQMLSRSGTVFPGVATVLFNAMACSAWDEPRRNDVARHVACRQESLELKPARAGFVAAANRTAASNASDKPTDRGEIGRQGMERRGPLVGRQDGCDDGRCVLIEGHDGCRLEAFARRQQRTVRRRAHQEG